MVGTKSELEVHVAGVARALEDLSEWRDRVTDAEGHLTEMQQGRAKAEAIFQERRDALFEKFPELAPAGHVVAIGSTPPTPGQDVIEVDDDTPPDPLGLRRQGTGDDEDHVDFDETSAFG